MSWDTSVTSGPAYFSPHGFRSTVDLLQIKKDESSFRSVCDEIRKKHAEMNESLEFLARANNAMTAEIRSSLRSVDQHENTESLDSEIESMHLASDNQFLRVTFRSIKIVRTLIEGLRSLATVLDPQGVYLPKEGLGDLNDSIEDMQKMHAVVQLNGPALERYVGAVFGTRSAKGHVVNYSYEIINTLHDYNQALVKRHSVDGFQIHGDPIITDVAMSIFENIDFQGEIEAGDDMNHMSAYTKRKALILARTIGENPINGFIRKQGAFIEYLINSLSDAWRWSDKLEKIFSGHVIQASVKWDVPYCHIPSKMEFDTVLQHIEDMEPSLIKYKDRAVMLSAEERFQTKFMNETLSQMVEIMSSENVSSEELIKYVLERRAELSKRNRDDNSFYTCKIGEGNRFKQIPPGMLTVVPGERPNVSINEIWGSGFDAVRDHIESIEMGAKWHDLFVATSPSKTADKSNVLMIGPQGCGKSQILRAVGSDSDSISVFAQGSDFLTCWLGEAEKNPKRLFEGAAKLQKESGKHVYILIDEADSVMKKQEEKRQGEVDLTLEFQICMDGVIHYPKLTVVAATNSPARMPMTMIRRFSKVLIVGELSQKDRISIMQHYVGFMPTSGFSDRNWELASQRLDGATGDVIRKIIDHVWREKMTWFVKNQSERAEEMMNWLSSGVKFDISAFTPESRAEFKKKLGPHVHIEPSDLEKSINIHLKNVGIQGEIRTAQAVYKEAHELLDSLDQSGIILS